MNLTEKSVIYERRNSKDGRDLTITHHPDRRQHAHHQNTRTMGICEIAVSRDVDYNGIPEWSFRFYRPSEARQTTGPEPASKVTAFTIQGSPGRPFRLRIIYDYWPWPNPNDTHVFRVASNMAEAEFVDACTELRYVPIDNTPSPDYDYSSQVWVFDALDGLFELNLFEDNEDDLYNAMYDLSEVHQTHAPVQTATAASTPDADEQQPTTPPPDATEQGPATSTDATEQGPATSMDAPGQGPATSTDAPGQGPATSTDALGQGSVDA